MPDDKVKNDKHISDRYANAIDYYWQASRNNKKWYKLTRAFAVILGALVTLIASLASSTILMHNPLIKDIFVIATPILAACLSIIAGFSQSFQWGSAWQNMFLTAQQLQKEYDRYLVSEPSQRDFITEADLLNKFVINESDTLVSPKFIVHPKSVISLPPKCLGGRILRLHINSVTQPFSTPGRI